MEYEKYFFVSGLRKALLPSSSCCLPSSTPYSTFPGFFPLLALTLAKTKIPPRSRMKERNLSICLLLKSQETLQQLEPGWPQTILITSRIHNRSVFHVYLVFFFFHLFVFQSFQGTREAKRIKDWSGHRGEVFITQVSSEKKSLEPVGSCRKCHDQTYEQFSH